MTVAELASKLLVYDYEELSFGTAIPKARIDVAVLTEALAEARLEALEQAAQVAATHYPTRTLTFVCVERNCSFSGSDQSWANHIAAAIRALKAAQHGEKELRKAQ